MFIGAYTFVGQYAQANKKLLVAYPIALFYLFLAYLVIYFIFDIFIMNMFYAKLFKSPNIYTIITACTLGFAKPIFIFMAKYKIKNNNMWNVFKIY